MPTHVRPWLPLLAGAALGVALAACGDPLPSASQGAATEVPAEAVHVWLPSFVATSVANVDDGPSSCVAQLDVQLSLTGERIDGVFLSDQVEGACDTLVLENKRFYEMTLLSDQCGSKTYEGLLATARGTSRLRLVDHSQRTCARAATDSTHAVELTERHPGSPPRHFAGSW